MKYIFAILVSITANAQFLDLSQSSSSIDWKVIENDSVKLIYPDYLQSESHYIANLVEHYSKVVGLSYGIDNPKQFSLIIRPESALPNGYVTLGPRRSEWFSAVNYSTLTGSAEWYQTLAIHEYRHIIQYDNYNRGTVSLLDTLLGDAGIATGQFLGLKNWYFEGDAVWSETKYTDSGRGRSPRFLARMKALALANEIPTYDEFVNGTYNNLIPNHYVYGYLLVTNASKKFGKDFWDKVTRYVSRFPHPYRIYSGFEELSGQSFEDFYNETFSDLQKSWKEGIKKTKKVVDYRDNVYPYVYKRRMYRLKGDLDSNWKIISSDLKGRNKKEVIELNYSKMNKISYSKNMAVVTQNLVDSRYGHRNYSDLFLINLNSGELDKITQGQRLYNPSLNNSATKILVSKFDEKNKWSLVEMNTKGKVLRNFTFSDYKVINVSYIDDSNASIIYTNKLGEKAVGILNLGTKEISNLLPFSRNNIDRVISDKSGRIFFEAQSKGLVDIYSISNGGRISKCSSARVTATTPYSDGESLYYSDADESGSVIRKSKLSSCDSIDKNSLINYKYLSQGPSDNYGGFDIVNFAKHTSMFDKNTRPYKSEDYGSVDKRLFIPHSWSFLGGRGYLLSALTDNYLRTMSLSASYGQDSETGQHFSNFSLALKKYYPIFVLSGGLDNPEVDKYLSNDTLLWEEMYAELSMIIPYSFKRNLYNVDASLSLTGGLVEAKKYELNDIDAGIEDRDFQRTSVGVSFNVSKDKAYRSIVSPVKLSYIAQYDNMDNDDSSDLSNYRFYQGASLTLPSFFDHNYFQISYDQEIQKEKANGYQFTPYNTSPTGYVFSRGYDYFSVPEYQKMTFNYLLPLAYPDFNLSGLYYLRRMTLNAFYDVTKVEFEMLSEYLYSYGAELEFESTLFRIIPINFGVRYSYRHTSEDDETEFYLATSYSF